MYFPKSIENALNRIKYPFEVNVNGYRLFWGYGIGEYDEMHMFDKNGNCLEQIKE